MNKKHIDTKLKKLKTLLVSEVPLISPGGGVGQFEIFGY
jgi:hypothetical protein